MSDSNRTDIAGIVINAILVIAGMVWAWFLNKRTIQATLQAAHPAAKPAAKPKKKRYLTVTERRFLRRYRFQQVFFAVILIAEPYNYQIFHPWLPKSRFDWIGLIMSLIVMSMYAALIVAIEKKEIKQIKNGEFAKRMKRLSRERKTRPSVQH